MCVIKVESLTSRSCFCIGAVFAIRKVFVFDEIIRKWRDRQGRKRIERVSVCYERCRKK